MNTFGKIFNRMKKLVLLSLFAVTVLSANAQCNAIFISEIVEGWSNNKAVEIYNPTATTVSLDGYGLVRFSNGSTSYGSIAYLDGYSIAPNDVIVIVLDKNNPDGTGLEAPVWEELAAAADVFINPNYDNGVWPMYFNGNDAIAIVTDNGQTLVDLYGRIGEGTGFGGWSAFGTNASGGTLYASTDHTQIRKSTVTSGVTTNPSSFDVFAQYDTLPANTFTFLGTHTCDCSVSVSENVERSTSIYPNPLTGDVLNVVSPSVIRSIRIFDNAGRIVFVNGTILDRMTRIQTNAIAKGAYTIEVISENGNVNRQNFIK
jgi:predicted extracellular nuclease